MRTVNDTDDEVLSALATLAEKGAITLDDLAFLREHGRSYRGRELPYGLDQEEPGSCFAVADKLEGEWWGDRVRGFALRPWPMNTRPFPHAWVTTNGRDAVDPSWDRQWSCRYFGIKGRRHEARLDRISRAIHRHYGLDSPRRQLWIGAYA